MGKGKVVAIGLGVLLVGMSALQAIGANVEADFAAGDDLPSGSADTASAAVVQQRNTSRDQSDARASTMNDGRATEKSHRPMSEGQRLALSEVDPEMKQASDFIGALINANGHLCARVSNVVPTGAGTFRVTCVVHSNGLGRATYLVNGETNEATPA